MPPSRESLGTATRIVRCSRARPRPVTRARARESAPSSARRGRSSSQSGKAAALAQLRALEVDHARACPSAARDARCKLVALVLAADGSLGEGDHVERVVEATVVAAVQTVFGSAAAAGRDRGRAVAPREAAGRGEALDGADSPWISVRIVPVDGTSARRRFPSTRSPARRAGSRGSPSTAARIARRARARWHQSLPSTRVGAFPMAR